VELGQPADVDLDDRLVGRQQADLLAQLTDLAVEVLTANPARLALPQPARDRAIADRPACVCGEVPGVAARHSGTAARQPLDKRIRLLKRAR
jgi:hypothetical protein